MGSQTLEILRQGVWASLTGGWFYDPHQGVFCNVVHLYLWLFLLCSPFVAYLYFPGTWISWFMYCIGTSLTILGVKLINMALHRLYDRAQTMSETNLKNQFFKVTKETEPREDEAGIEMKVMRNDGSVEQAINEASEENSMMSIENVNSIIDLKVDVHRKNSSESIELMFYAPSVMSSNSQQDQQSIFGSASVTKSIRSSSAVPNCVISSEANTKYLTVYPEDDNENSPRPSTSKAASASIASNATLPNNSTLRQINLLRKSSEDHKRRRQRRRPERQSSLDASADSTIVPKLVRNQSDTIATAPSSIMRTATFLYPQNNTQDDTSAVRNRNKSNTTESNALHKTSSAITSTSNIQRLSTTTTSLSSIATPTVTTSTSAVVVNPRNSRLHRHRSSETHDERIKCNRNLFLPIHHVSSAAIGGGISDIDELELSLGGSAQGVDGRGRTLKSWILGSSSDVYIEDDSYTKSDLGIEQIDGRSSNASGRAVLLLQQQQQQLNSHYPHQHQYRAHHHSTNIRKDSNSTMSALQLPVMPTVTDSNSKNSSGASGSGNISRRRHSNATSLFKSINNSTTATGGNLGLAAGHQQPTVRRIKSAALEISCPRPSVSNLSPHPNSVEAINGQQIKNPQSALLPPPSKCLVRNPHLNLCPKFGGSFGESNGNSSLNFSGSANGSTTGLIESVYPIVEQADEKISLDFNTGVEQKRLHASDTDMEIVDDDFKDFDDNLDHILNDLQQTQNQLDDLKASYEEQNRKLNRDGTLDSDDCCRQTEDDTPSTSQALRERSHSTDSETDNNGSRSPLLSGKTWDNTNSASKDTDNSLRIEIAAIQKCKHPTNKFCQHLFQEAAAQNNKAEGDSGCPSSDCEQISASSKDMLLAGMESNDKSILPNATRLSEENEDIDERVVPASNVEDDDENLNRRELSDSNSNAANGKNLGAIPKVVKYREINEVQSGKDLERNIPINRSQLYKLCNVTDTTSNNNKTNSETAIAPTPTIAPSRTSSPPSSRSISADSFSADVHKMLWLMHGGTLDENGRPIGSFPNNVVPPNLPSEHIRFYQNAFQAANNQMQPIGADGMSLSERLYYRDKVRRNSKQVSEPGNSSIGEVSHTHELQSTNLSNNSQNRNAHQTLGVVVAPSSLNSRVSNAATLSIQGLINVINDERSSSQVRTHNSGNAAAAAILDSHIDSYCDFWRPACMLSSEKPIVPKSFYKYRFKCFRFKHEFKISMDRLELLSLFDRDLHWFHILLSVVLSATVAYLGSTILQLGYYKDIFAFLFCVVIAGSQYSLVKSVQPDAASPIHGFNKTVAYSRAIYFSCCSGLLLLLHKLKESYEQESTVYQKFFGITYAPKELTAVALEVLYLILLCFPIIFSLGLFPQINTFLMYFLEQIDMHVFGGNAAGSLVGAFLCLLRSALGIAILYGPLYAALIEGRGTQYILFSIFCALLIPLGYHLSRSASDFSHIWALIKNCIVSTYRDDDDELSAKSANGAPDHKTASSTLKRKRRNKTENDKTEINCSNEQIEMSSLEKIITIKDHDDVLTNQERKMNKSKASSLGSSSQTIGKPTTNCKKVLTASNSFASVGGGECAANLYSEHESNANAETEDEAEKDQDIDDKMSSSSTTNPGDISTLTNGMCANGTTENGAEESPDPLPKKLQNTVNTRLKNDLVVMTLQCVAVLGLHSSTVFTVLQPDLNIVLYAFTGALGFLLHYIIPQMRKHMPWLCFARPLLKQKEFGQFEVSNAPKIMWFEKFYIYLSMVERNVLFPLVVLSALTADAQIITNKFGVGWGTLIVAVCALKFVRNAYSDSINQYLIVLFTVLLFRVDFAVASESFLIDYFFVSLAYRKCCDFLLKLQFIVTYIAPWQITWGSAFHAFAQPFSVPHSAMLFLQAGISAILSTPLNPFLGSAIFLTSYVRPIKFWERDYNTRRIDHSNTRLSSQLERDLGADDNNLNSIFYEHLTRSLQHSLCGDLLMGRWGNVNQGDCFVLASDYLNCLVHIIELGNGLCTFQMRGLEFRGTYCQQREVEAISEDVEDNDGCCCCDPGHIPRMLSANAMFSTRWLAWQVVAAQYVLEGYSISDNLASATLQVFEYRKVLITYYIKSIIYYVVKNPKLDQWLSSGPIQDALQHTLSRQFVDLDPIFNYNLDEDFDFRAVGITRPSFCYVYLSWINFCCDKRKENQNTVNETTIPAQTHNDSKSTPNLSTAATAVSQSQHLRARPQKSATMSDSGTVNNHSTEHIGNSQSFAIISRQTSESAPGLTGTNVSQVPLEKCPLNSSTAALNSATKLQSSHLRNQKVSNFKTPFNAHSPIIDNKAENSTPADNNGIPIIKLKVPSIAKDSPIVSLCLALSLLGRRSLATASHSSLTGVEFFLHGLHALFKGDFRITSPRDEWVFADMELLHSVVAPAVKMALKLQQDHITNPDEFLDPNVLYEAIDTCSKDLVISHEADPVWRSAVLRGAPNLLALRHVMEDGSDEYRIIRLTKRFLSFRVIKLNRECVRGLWAGQQQELIYLRNRNPERGSIQNAKQALRNIINSCCDQPIGYPIYVSPLTTSYADTNEQLCEIIGGAITLESIKVNVLDWWRRIRERCRQGCSSGSTMETTHLGVIAVGPVCNAGGESGEIAQVYISAPFYNTLTGSFLGLRSGNLANLGGSLSAQYGSDGLVSMRSGLAVIPVKPTSTTLLAGLRKSQTQSTSSRSDRERRATLPIASTSLGAVGGHGGASTLKDISSTNTDSMQNNEQEYDSSSKQIKPHPSDTQASNSPRYTKISCSSGCIGVGNIITTPGDYPRKTKGPICLTAGMSVDATKSNSDITMITRKPRIELYKKVIIVDETEIYDLRRYDVVWPTASGGRLSWEDWKPRVGMVGHVVHYWVPNHTNQRFRSNLSRVVYLIEIGEHFVPVGEYGLREYNQIVDSSTEEMATIGATNSRRGSALQQMDELQKQIEGLTPILGSSLESPTSQLGTASNEGFDDSHILEATTSRFKSSNTSARPKINAVSSSSSEDDMGMFNIDMQKRELVLNMLNMMAEQANDACDSCNNEFEDFDYDSNVPNVEDATTHIEPEPEPELKPELELEIEPEPEKTETKIDTIQDFENVYTTAVTIDTAPEDVQIETEALNVQTPKTTEHADDDDVCMKKESTDNVENVENRDCIKMVEGSEAASVEVITIEEIDNETSEV